MAILDIYALNLSISNSRSFSKSPQVDIHYGRDGPVGGRSHGFMLKESLGRRVVLDGESDGIFDVDETHPLNLPN